MKNKRITDIMAMAFLVCAIATGFILHSEVHHRYIYDDTALWVAHIISGLIVAVALLFHCLQHKFWFKNYAKIPTARKGVTSLLFIVAILVVITGIILALGSHSHFISIFHYITGIAFTLLAITHVIGRRKLFTSLFKSPGK